LGKINILKNDTTLAHLIKCTVLERALWDANTFPNDSKTSFYKFYFLVRRTVVISVATDGDSTGEARESDHLFGCAKLMLFFFIFFLSHFFWYVFFYFSFIFRIVVCVYSSLFLYLE